MAVIEAYVTNLGKYNEGELASALLKFPTTREAAQEVLKQIGIDNIRYEEIFIADYDGDLSELNACLGEYESIDELNHLACLLSELDKSDLEKFEAVVASGEHTSGAGDLINLAENLDCYDFYIGVSDDETLGRIYAEDMEMIDIPENLRNYFDYEAYGRDMRINEDGSFVKGGFLLPNGSQFIEYYHGREDIPTNTRFLPIHSSPSGNRWQLKGAIIHHPEVGALRSPKAPRRRAVIFRSHGLLQIIQGTLRFPCAGCRQLPFCGLAIWGHLAL